MRRVHLFELEDQPWLPAVVRDAGTAYLAFAARVGSHARVLAPTLAELVRRTGETRIVDLCSGGGGPVIGITEALAREGVYVKAVLTDRFPNHGSLERAQASSQGRIELYPDPVDAKSVPDRLRGIRTMFNALHHFEPKTARAILADAAANMQPIAVFELVGRQLPLLASMLLAPLVVAVAIPLLRPFRLAWLPLTYLVPVIPLFVAWDGLVSCLRVYSERELRELVASIDSGPGYTWQIGRLPTRVPGAHVTFLTGGPLEPTTVGEPGHSEDRAHCAEHGQALLSAAP